MNNPFKRNRRKDERITNLQNKIYREIYHLVLIICVLSLIFKYATSGADFKNVWLELVILLVTSIYYTVRSTGMGIFSAEVEMHDQTNKRPMSVKTILIGALFGAGWAIFLGIHSAVSYADTATQSVYYFLLTSVVSFIIYIPFLMIVNGFAYWGAKKRSDRAVAKELEDEEEQDEER
ncbi:hypothetical protein ERJ70_06150 [Sediminibacillus dalangtanensis]|uniref:TRAP-type C4-dicarboxylate transport system, small permease component n=1 Tax=Sediminibacillus dalangtanensis TaxID=2729421 RepID=A0ABX7VSD8_9BACI|nr:DUF6773 family protein [Sediminibacillus dalangtanensis]QTM98919.1 hypothetical protein ERJ70_06150 [Sediminibacillus dalangtanensis]